MTTTNSDSPETAWLDEDEQRAWWALLMVGSGLFDTLTADLKAAAELTLEDYEVLHLLSQESEHSLRVGALADAMLASRTRLSQRLDRLGDRGLVRREPCPHDGRAINVVLTEDGWSLLQRIAPLHLESVRRHTFDHLTPSDVKAIARGLDKIAEHLHATRSC